MRCTLFLSLAIMVVLVSILIATSNIMNQNGIYVSIAGAIFGSFIFKKGLDELIVYFQKVSDQNICYSQELYSDLNLSIKSLDESFKNLIEFEKTHHNMVLGKMNESINILGNISNTEKCNCEQIVKYGEDQIYHNQKMIEAIEVLSQSNRSTIKNLEDILGMLNTLSSDDKFSKIINDLKESIKNTINGNTVLLKKICDISISTMEQIKEFKEIQAAHNKTTEEAIGVFVDINDPVVSKLTEVVEEVEKISSDDEISELLTDIKRSLNKQTRDGELNTKNVTMEISELKNGLEQLVKKLDENHKQILITTKDIAERYDSLNKDDMNLLKSIFSGK